MASDVTEARDVARDVVFTYSADLVCLFCLLCLARLPLLLAHVPPHSFSFPPHVRYSSLDALNMIIWLALTQLSILLNNTNNFKYFQKSENRYKFLDIIIILIDWLIDGLIYSYMLMSAIQPSGRWYQSSSQVLYCQDNWKNHLYLKPYNIYTKIFIILWIFLYLS